MLEAVDSGARLAAVVFTLLQVVLRSLLWLPIGLGLLLLFPPDLALDAAAVAADREVTFVTGIAELLPSGVRGLLLTAMLAALATFLAAGGLDDHLKRVLPANRARRDAMAEALERHLPEAIWSLPPGGLFMWVTLPRGHDTRRLHDETSALGVRFSSGDLFHAKGGSATTMRLTFSAVDAERIERGIAAMGDALRRIGGDAEDQLDGDQAIPIL